MTGAPPAVKVETEAVGPKVIFPADGVGLVAALKLMIADDPVRDRRIPSTVIVPTAAPPVFPTGFPEVPEILPVVVTSRFVPGA